MFKLACTICWFVNFNVPFDRFSILSEQSQHFLAITSRLGSYYYLSRLMGKPTICIGKNKDADQLRGNCKADQRLCFRYSDSTIPLLLKSKISSFSLFSVLVQVGLCQTWSETTLLVFPHHGSFVCLPQGHNLVGV